MSDVPDQTARGDHLLTFTNDDFRVELKVDGITDFGWAKLVVAVMHCLEKGDAYVWPGLPGFPVPALTEEEAERLREEMTRPIR